MVTALNKLSYDNTNSFIKQPAALRKHRHFQVVTMKPSTAAIGAVCILFIALSSSIALAWTPDWGPVANRNTGYYYAGYAGNGFQTSSMRGSWDVAPMRSQAQSQVALGTMNRYGSGNYGNSIRSAGWNGNRADRTGPYLTAPGDTALAFPVARYQDPVYRGPRH